jgi:hypothetical protein
MTNEMIETYIDFITAKKNFRRWEFKLDELHESEMIQMQKDKVSLGLKSGIYKKAKAKTPMTEEVIKQRISLWAMFSYPERGDSAFVVYGDTNIGQGFALNFWSGLKARAIKQFFIRELQWVLADIKGEGSTSIETQEQSAALFEKDPELFFLEMFYLHKKGGVPYGDHKAISKWLNQNYQGKPK